MEFVLILRTDLEEVNHHVQVILLLFLRVHLLNEVEEQIKVHIDLCLDQNFPQLVKGNQSVLVLVHIIKEVLDVVHLE